MIVRKVVVYNVIGAADLHYRNLQPNLHQVLSLFFLHDSHRVERSSIVPILSLVDFADGPTAKIFKKEEVLTGIIPDEFYHLNFFLKLLSGQNLEFLAAYPKAVIQVAYYRNQDIIFLLVLLLASFSSMIIDTVTSSVPPTALTHLGLLFLH